MAMLKCNSIYADGTACIETVNFGGSLPNEFTESEDEALLHEYLCEIAPVVRVPPTPLDINDVYADGTACAGSPKNVNNLLPCEFTRSESEASFDRYLSDIAPPVVMTQMSARPIGVGDVYADGTACTGGTPKNANSGIPCEWTEPEEEASFHEYLCDIAPPVMVTRMSPTPLDVYADGTACTGSCPKNIDIGLPCEFIESEKETLLHEYLSDIAPPVRPMPLDASDVYADGTACTAPRNDGGLPSEFMDTEREASFHEYLSEIAPPVVMPQVRPVPLDHSNVYADGTASTATKNDGGLPSEFMDTEREASFHEYLSDIAPPVVMPQVRPVPLDHSNVYADGTASTDSKNDGGLPSEFVDTEREASFHEYLSDIAPPVVMPEVRPVPLDVSNVYADGTACTSSSPRKTDNGLPCEFIEPEKEASLHEYLCDIAPLVEVSSPKMRTQHDNLMEDAPPDQLLGA
jgi:hypothetical protein